MQYTSKKLPHNSFPKLNYFDESIFSINRNFFLFATVNEWNVSFEGIELTICWWEGRWYWRWTGWNIVGEDCLISIDFEPITVDDGPGKRYVDGDEAIYMINFLSKYRHMSNLHLIIEHNIQFLYVCIRKEEKKKSDTRPLQRRSRI